MAYRAAVVGGSGYTGAELLRLLAAHPEIEVAHVTATSNAGVPVAELYPSLTAAYGLLNHRHTAEMELGLGRVSPTGGAQVLFTPHLVPMTRGVLATCYARPAATGLSTESLLEHYRDFYAGEPFVAVLNEPPSTGATRAGNAVHVTVRF